MRPLGTRGRREVDRCAVRHRSVVLIAEIIAMTQPQPEVANSGKCRTELIYNQSREEDIGYSMFGKKFCKTKKLISARHSVREPDFENNPSSNDGSDISLQRGTLHAHATSKDAKSTPGVSGSDDTPASRDVSEPDQFPCESYEEDEDLTYQRKMSAPGLPASAIAAMFSCGMLEFEDAGYCESFDQRVYCSGRPDCCHFPGLRNED